jgi:hypothetical protein
MFQPLTVLFGTAPDRAPPFGGGATGGVLSSASDDGGGWPARSALAMFAPPICRRNRRIQPTRGGRFGIFVSSDPTKTAA